MGLINLPAFLIGFSVETLARFARIPGRLGHLHPLKRAPSPRPSRMLIGAPELPHWHHARERAAGNYANISPLMDIIFGTYRCPAHEPESLGVEEPCRGSISASCSIPSAANLAQSSPSRNVT